MQFKDINLNWNSLRENKNTEHKTFKDVESWLKTKREIEFS